MPVRTATKDDVPAMIELVSQRRAMLAKGDPDMFVIADNAAELSDQFFTILMDVEDAINLVWEEDGAITGMAMAMPFTPPPVYVPKGKVYMLDDLAISEDASWDKEGAALIEKVQEQAINKGAGALIAVCPVVDGGAAKALEAAGHYVVSQWWRKQLA